MKNFKKNVRTVSIAVLGILILSSVAALAQKQFMLFGARPDVKVSLAAFVERDKALVPSEKITLVKSGEMLEWSITSVNEGNAAANEYKAVGHVPAGMTLVNGSAKAEGSARILYSIDRGKNFSAQPTIEQRQADGSVKRVPAPMSMYTDVRYEWADPLAPGGKVTASYRVQVN